MRLWYGYDAIWVLDLFPLSAVYPMVHPLAASHLPDLHPALLDSPLGLFQFCQGLSNHHGLGMLSMLGMLGMLGLGAAYQILVGWTSQRFWDEQKGTRVLTHSLLGGIGAPSLFVTKPCLSCTMLYPGAAELQSEPRSPHWRIWSSASVCTTGRHSQAVLAYEGFRYLQVHPKKSIENPQA